MFLIILEIFRTMFTSMSYKEPLTIIWVSNLDENLDVIGYFSKAVEVRNFVIDL